MRATRLSEAPWQVRLFWWLTATFAIYQIGRIAYADFIIDQPSLMKLPPEIRDNTRDAIQMVGIIHVLALGGFILLPAWLVAFRKWPWALIILFAADIYRLVIGSMIEWSYLGWDAAVAEFGKTLRYPGAYVVICLFVAQALLGLSAPARAWYRNRTG